MNWRRWMRDNFDDLEPLMVLTDQYAPGAIIDKDDFEIQEHVRNYVPAAEMENLETVMRPAALAQVSYEQKASSGFSLGLLNLASFNVSTSSNLTASVTVGTVTQHRFTDQMSRIKLKNLLRALKQSNPQRFREIDERLIILETFAARKLQVQIKSNTGLVVGVEAKQMLQPLESVKIDVSNTDNSTVTIEMPEGQPLLPFGFRAFKL